MMIALLRRLAILRNLRRTPLICQIIGQSGKSKSQTEQGKYIIVSSMADHLTTHRNMDIGRGAGKLNARFLHR
jgi:hypothetical protein